MCIVAFLLLSSASLLSASPPSTIRSVIVEGNEAVSAREVLGWLSSRPSQQFSETVTRNDLREIRARYRALGFLGARAEFAAERYSADSSSVDLIVRIQEGKKTVVASVVVRGTSVLTPPEALDQFDVRPGAPLDQSALEQDLEVLVKRYEMLGYPFVQCSVDSMGVRPGGEEDSLEVTIGVREGERVTIDEVRVEGNRETDPSVVVRESRVVPGELYNPAKIGAIRERLNRLNIFSGVSEPELYLRGPKGGLLIRVQEGSTNTFDGIVGYIPGATAGQSGYFTGLATVAMRNLFGTGRKLSVRWQKEDRTSQELALRYVEPWLFGYPVNLGGGFLQRQQDTSYVRRVLDLNTELMLSDQLSIGLILSSESVIPSSDTTINRAFESTTTTIGGEIQYDTRDDLYSPTKGARYHTDYHYGRKRIRNVPAGTPAPVATDAAVQRLGVDLDCFFATFTRQVLAVGLHGREIFSGQPEESEMYRLGGTNTLRGYRESEFLGSQVIWSNTEYRFLLARRSFFFGFLDTGYYLRAADEARGIPQSQAFKYGYGIGVRLDTSLGNMGVSFALGEGDSFRNAKIHFGLVNEF